MSTGSGSTGGSGAGYRVEVNNLRAFATQVRGLLNEFQSSADGTRTYNQSGVGPGAFGPFPEAQQLHQQYEQMRTVLRDVFNNLQDAVDETQRKADLTATNYEDQEHETSQTLKLSTDGWSTDIPPSPMTASQATCSPSAPRTQSSSGNGQTPSTW